MSQSRSSARTLSGLLVGLPMTLLAVARAIIRPRQLFAAPAPTEPPAPPEQTTPTETPPAPSPPDYRAQYVKDRNALLQAAKITALVFGVLFVLTLEYTPMVVADDQLEEQFSGQVRSLVLVEGYVDRLDRLVENNAEAWKQRVVEQVERALRKVIALDAYSQALSTAGKTAGTTIEAPAFLTTCAQDDADVRAWLDAQTVEEHWQDLVARCIIEPIDADFDSEEQVALMARLNEARRAVFGAIARARQEFPVSAGTTAASLAAAAPPAETTAEQQVQADLDRIEAQVGAVVRIVETGANAAVQPPPRNWVARFTGTEGTLRSFRDNLLLAYASPFGTKVVASSRSATSSNRGIDVAAQDPLLTSTLSFTVSLKTTAQQLEDDVSAVLARQEDLQAGQAERTTKIQSAVPGAYQPFVAVVRPKYFVLGFPLALAIAAAYFLVSYTVIRWRAGEHGAGDSLLLTTLVFLVLALAPLAALTYLFRPYDWPQFADSWWQWMHRVPLAGFGLVVLGCMAWLLRAGFLRGRAQSA